MAITASSRYSIVISLLNIFPLKQRRAQYGCRHHPTKITCNPSKRLKYLHSRQLGCLAGRIPAMQKGINRFQPAAHIMGIASRKPMPQTDSMVSSSLASRSFLRRLLTCCLRELSVQSSVSRLILSNIECKSLVSRTAHSAHGVKNDGISPLNLL